MVPEYPPRKDPLSLHLCLPVHVLRCIAYAEKTKRRKDLGSWGAGDLGL